MLLYNRSKHALLRKSVNTVNEFECHLRLSFQENTFFVSFFFSNFDKIFCLESRTITTWWLLFTVNNSAKAHFTYLTSIARA